MIHAENLSESIRVLDDFDRLVMKYNAAGETRAAAAAAATHQRQSRGALSRPAVVGIMLGFFLLILKKN